MRRVNLLKNKFETMFQTYPFNEISITDIEDAVLAGIQLENSEITEIVCNNEKPTFENTIEKFEQSGFVLDQATTLLYNLLSAESCDELEKLSQKLSPIISEHRSKVFQNPALFKKINSVIHEYIPKSEEELSLINKIKNMFADSGANLNNDKKEKLVKINSELSSLKLLFSQNHLSALNSYVLHVDKLESIKGLPDLHLEHAKMLACEKKLEGWCFGLQATSYIPFMTHVQNRELRKELYMAYNQVCLKNDNNCNLDIVRRLVNLRREKAQLLGYHCYADFVLKDRMAESTENVYDFLHKLIKAYLPIAKSEINEVAVFAKSLEGEYFVLEPWDFLYFSNKLKIKKFGFDEEQLRPYFEIGRAIQGVFSLAQRLYGISFVKNSNLQVYHEDVEAYEVYDENNNFLAILYTDFYPRKTKQSGAWMTNYKESDGKDRPHVSIVMNFTKPTDSKPSLLTHRELETFLHEFGHALHSIFSITKYKTLSGTNVFWDFVELPSQLMENYAIEIDFLKSFARHYLTNETIPDKLIKSIIDSRNFNVGYLCIRQLSFALLDMAYYSFSNPFDVEIEQFEKNILKDVKLFSDVDSTCITTQFEHIMSGGYSAGYYSYKWAEVLDADAFSLFKQNGIFDIETAKKFRREILERGGTSHPMKLYENFRGRKPSINALLERNGILPNDN